MVQTCKVKRFAQLHAFQFIVQLLLMRNRSKMKLPFALYINLPVIVQKKNRKNKMYIAKAKAKYAKYAKNVTFRIIFLMKK